MTWKDILKSPTYTFGAMAAIGMGLLGAAATYGLPKWVAAVGGIMAALGSALAHFGAADNKDLPPKQ